MMTANGPNSASEQCDVWVESIGIEVKPYVLPDTPSVLSFVRNTGGANDNAPRKSDADLDLIVSVRHSVQPVVLEDNQATIRVLESGKSPAFRHADKTQRLNLGWISEQFKRKHYELAYINTLRQAADVLTKPSTSAEKWNRALQLLCVGPHKLPARKSAAATSSSIARPTPRPGSCIRKSCVLFGLFPGVARRF